MNHYNTDKRSSLNASKDTKKSNMAVQLDLSNSSISSENPF